MTSENEIAAGNENPAGSENAEEASALPTLTIDQFTGREGESFFFICQTGNPDDDLVRVELELKEVTDLTGRSAVGLDDDGNPVRVPFSLLFRGPKDQLLAGDIYDAEHVELGTVQLYAAPVEVLQAPSAAEFYWYESVFN